MWASCLVGIWPKQVQPDDWFDLHLVVCLCLGLAVLVYEFKHHKENGLRSSCLAVLYAVLATPGLRFSILIQSGVFFFLCMAFCAVAALRGEFDAGLKAQVHVDVLAERSAQERWKADNVCLERFGQLMVFLGYSIIVTYLSYDIIERSKHLNMHTGVYVSYPYSLWASLAEVTGVIIRVNLVALNVIMMRSLHLIIYNRACKNTGFISGILKVFLLVIPMGQTTFHKYLAYILLFMGMLHGIAHAFLKWSDIEMLYLGFESFDYLTYRYTGLVVSVSLAFLFAFSTDHVLHKHPNVFRTVHMSALLCFVALAYHGKLFLEVSLSLGTYIFERVLRYSSAFFPKLFKITILPLGVFVEIDSPTPYLEGQFFILECPLNKDGSKEWFHSFAYSCPQEERLTLFVETGKQHSQKRQSAKLRKLTTYLQNLSLQDLTQSLSPVAPDSQDRRTEQNSLHVSPSESKRSSFVLKERLIDPTAGDSGGLGLEGVIRLDGPHAAPTQVIPAHSNSSL